MLLRFNTTLADTYLTKEQIQKVAPLALASAPTNDRLSGKYLHINTENIIDDMTKLRWLPVEAAQRKSKATGTLFSKHMVSFQNPEIKIKGKNGDDAYPRILLTNSHDGFNSFQFRVGIFRLVCSNGLVVADEQFTCFKLRHKGYTFEELQLIINTTIEDLPNRVQVFNRMQVRMLTQEEKRQLAIDAMQLRTNVIDAKWDEETITDVLEPLRDADKGEDLWSVFNVIQEKITQGGYKAALQGAKVRKVRKIKSFERDLNINQQLFRLATTLLN